ncbi:hypothetical protein [Flavisolibacter nicotianae]|uniref:hypothetical protein n=1 Tax=Flavisolibacter nicotianae TaxID=2364882 RepID=UPI0013C45C96|nr:hypothetical protein [Flavisolibacter nicotianae]
MKKFVYATLAAALLLGTFAFKTVRANLDVLGQLQIDPTEAKESVFNNFQDGVLDFPYSTLVTTFAPGKREAAVRELGDFIKAYTESAAFAEKYKAAREAARPQGLQSADEKIKQRLAQIDLDIETNQADMAKASGEMKKLHQLTIDELRKEKKALGNPADPAYASFRKEATKATEWETQQAREDEKYWLEEYPPTAKERVKRRLAEFQDLTKDIDFTAKLVKSGNKLVFADPGLEAKSWEWKRCFRCGRETIAAARQYAQQWLSSLR